MSEEVKLTEKPMIGTSRQRIIPAKFEPSKGNNLEFTIDEFGNLFCTPREQNGNRDLERGRMGKLTEKQKNFCEFYSKDPTNGTKAAQLAGYAKGASSEVEASRMLRNPKIQKYLKELSKPKEKIEKAKKASMDQVHEFWFDILTGKVEADINQQLKASEYVAKVNAAFTENTNTTLNFPKGIDINIVSESD